MATDTYSRAQVAWACMMMAAIIVSGIAVIVVWAYGL
jgi:hypothetical protein